MAQVKNKLMKSEVEEPMAELIKRKLIQNNMVLSFDAFESLSKMR